MGSICTYPDGYQPAVYNVRVRQASRPQSCVMLMGGYVVQSQTETLSESINDRNVVFGVTMSRVVDSNTSSVEVSALYKLVAMVIKSCSISTAFAHSLDDTNIGFALTLASSTTHLLI